MKHPGKSDYRHWMMAMNGAACWLLLFGLAFWGRDSQLHLLLAQGGLMLLGGIVLTYAGSKGLEAWSLMRVGLFDKSARSHARKAR